MKKMKGHHRGTGTAREIPRSATFSPRKSYGIPEHETASGNSKKKR